MGYTHYWTLDRDMTDDELSLLGVDVRAIVLASGVPIAGPLGTGEPEYNDDEIALNGAEPDDYETFGLSRHKGWTFCKTRGDLPYDLVVTASLLAAKDRLGDAIHLSSDGDAPDWWDGWMLAGRALGRTVLPYVRED